MTSESGRSASIAAWTSRSVACMTGSRLFFWLQPSASALRESG